MDPARSSTNPPGQPVAPSATSAQPPPRRAACIAAILLIGLLLRLPFLTRPGHAPDVGLFAYWAYLADRFSLANVYTEMPAPDGTMRRWCNYPPVYLYALRALAAIGPLITGRPFDATLIDDIYHGTKAPGVAAAHALLKSPAILCDLATAVILFLFLRRRASPRAAFAISLIYVAQPVVIHNSTIWGQVDAVHTLFMLISVELAARRRTGAMAVFATLAVMTKPQALMLAPLWLAATFTSPEPGKKPGEHGPLARTPHRAPNDPLDHRSSFLRRIAAALAYAAATAALLAAPFLHGGAVGLWQSFAGAIGFFPYVHVNAFNAWFLIDPRPGGEMSFSLFMRDDAPWLLGLTPRTIGLIALLCVWLFVLLQLIRRRCNTASLAWAASVLPLAFFLLPTQIHERYIFPAIALWAWAYRPTRRWTSGWLLLSLAALLNALWMVPGPADSPCAQSIANFMHADSTGRIIGVSCAVSLLCVLGITLAHREPTSSPPSGLIG